MSRNTKIVLGIVAVLLVLCICLCGISFIALQSAGQFLQQAVVTDATQVASTGADIAEYEVPAGYDEQFGMSLFGFSLVGFSTGQGENAGLIMLMQFPEFAGLSQEEMEQQLRQSIQQQTDMGDLQLEPVDQLTRTIRDQEVALTVSEGTTSEGERVRQITGVFQGRGGPTLLMVLGPVDGWDQAGVDAFISSIR